MAETLTAIGTLAAGIAALLTLAVVIATAIYARNEVREARRARYAHLLVDLLMRWNDELREARQVAHGFASPEELRDSIAKFHEENDAQYYELVRVPIFLEDLAWIQHEGLIDVDALFRRFSLTIEWEWEWWESTMTWIRGASAAMMFQGFEKLAAEAREYNAAHRREPASQYAKPR